MENSKKNREIDYNFEIVNVRTIFVKSAHLTRLLEGKNLQLHFVALKSYLKLWTFVKLRRLSFTLYGNEQGGLEQKKKKKRKEKKSHKNKSYF